MEAPDQPISAFGARTGVPILLNTSFNEPVIDTPAQALACSFRTRMDAVVINNTVVTRVSVPAGDGAPAPLASPGVSP